MYRADTLPQAELETHVTIASSKLTTVAPQTSYSSYVAESSKFEIDASAIMTSAGFLQFERKMTLVMRN